MKLTYDYARSGRLSTIRWDFFTFAGMSREGDGRTRCVRTFSVGESGDLRQTSERITDAKTGNVVDRRFSFAPRVKHWMSLSELPIMPQT